MLSLLLLLQGQVQAPANTPRPSHDALHYDVLLTVPAEGKAISGQVMTRLRLVGTGPIIMELDSVFEVRDIEVNGRAVGRVERRGDVITIPYKGRAGDTVTSLIRYHGTPRDGLIIRDSNGVRTAFADNWPNRAHRWFPLQDHPSDKATVTFRVAAPEGYQVIANGDPKGTSREQGGAVIWTYEMTRPIPVATMVIGVARMARTPMKPGGCSVRCVPVEIWTYPADSAYAVTGPFRRAPEMIDYFTSVIGEFPYSRLSHVQSSTIFGGMENSTAIFYDEKAYRRRTVSEGTVAHETAHQWFGDAITEREWTHLWLSEGFATYFAALWAEHLGGDSALRAAMKGEADGIYRSPATARPIVDSSDNLLRLLNSNNYNKGAWVLHSLRGLVGDSAFFRGIRAFYARYRDSTVMSDDFRREMEQVSGKGLAWFYRQSLHQPGYPKLEVSSRFDSERKTLALTIRQTQPENWGAYRLPGYELLIDGLLVRVDIEGRESHFSFDQFTAAPRNIEPDPNGWWLHESTVKGEE
jgi:aminopeptidase N